MAISFFRTAACAAVLQFRLSAAGPEGSSTAGESALFAQTFLWLAVILLLAKGFGSLAERLGQPPVLGELFGGILLGNLSLFGCAWFDPIATNGIIKFLAELGVVILLFQIGLESDIGHMLKVGPRAFAVAVVGVVFPLLLGAYLVAPLLLPGQSSKAYLFLGAALTATSVGITARVFKDLGCLGTKEARIVLGAAVIDDVLGLIILAVVSALVTSGSVGAGVVGLITLKAVGFLAASLVLGQALAPRLSTIFSRIHTGIGMKFTLAMVFALVFSYLAQRIGLAPIVGAFAAGLVLDPIHFKDFEDHPLVSKIREKVNGAKDEGLHREILATAEEHGERHVEELISSVAMFVVPVFFVITGMHVKLGMLWNPEILLVALGITVAAFVGKLVAGLAAGKTDKLIVGVGMVPRGEVGLIFANIGLGLGVMNDSLFSVVVIMVVLTTLVTPPILASLIKRQKCREA